MIIYANGKVKATAVDGKTQDVGISGPKQDELKTSNLEQKDLLLNILNELKKNNLYMSLMTDTYIKNSDLGGD